MTLFIVVFFGTFLGTGCGMGAVISVLWWLDRRDNRRVLD